MRRTLLSLLALLLSVGLLADPGLGPIPEAQGAAAKSKAKPNVKNRRVKGRIVKPKTVGRARPRVNRSNNRPNNNRSRRPMVRRAPNRRPSLNNRRSAGRGRPQPRVGSRVIVPRIVAPQVIIPPAIPGPGGPATSPTGPQATPSQPAYREYKLQLSDSVAVTRQGQPADLAALQAGQTVKLTVRSEKSGTFELTGAFQGIDDNSTKILTLRVPVSPGLNNPPGNVTRVPFDDSQQISAIAILAVPTAPAAK
jgi:hypothetical protein